MRIKIAAYIDIVIACLLFLVAALTPLIFTQLTTEYYEMPKLAFLVFATVLILGLWIFSWIVKGKVLIARTPLDLPLILLLLIILVSTYFNLSKSGWPVIYGNFPRVHGSAIAWVTYILMYFVAVSNLKSLNYIKTFIYILTGSAVIVSLLTLLSFFGFYLPFDFTKLMNFTPTGSSFSTVALLVLLLPLPLLSLINPNKYLPIPAAAALASLFGITIVLIGSIGGLVVTLLALALCLFISKPNQLKKSLPLLLIPVIATVIIGALSYIPLPGNANLLQAKVQNFPREIQLPFLTSWKISASVFRDSPFIGTGPSTYLFNFSAYKPVEFNLNKFWNFRFDTAYNEFLQIFGTFGALGLLAALFLTLTIINFSWKNLSIDHSIAEDSDHDTNRLILPALAISSLLSVALMVVHATTLVSIVTTLLILAMLMASQKSIRGKVSEFTLGIKASTANNNQFDLLPIIIFIAFLIAAIPILYKGTNMIAADYHHRTALTLASKDGKATYENLQRAEVLNDKVDLYRVDLAQTNFALANAIASQKGPTEASPGGSLTDDDKKTIQTLISQSINEGRASVALSPQNPQNWEVLASIYRNITGVAQNALQFSLSAYGQAIRRDPLNPVLRLNVGGLYYSIKNYDLAIRFFTDAANLKPDYANAYYNLSIALRDKGDLDGAKLTAEQVVSLLQTNAQGQDYKVASTYLADLKARIATGSAAQQANQPPAAQTDSALQNNKLPGVEVPDLVNPPQEATPEAVKKNPQASALPSTSPSPTASPQP